MFGIERRDLQLEASGLELRRKGNVGREIAGHAALFNVRTTIFPGYDEVVRPGAFSKTLKEDDAVALFNHDTSLVLGRRSAGTAEIREDARGLFYSVPVDEEDEVSKRVARKIERREIIGSSFGFRAVNAPEVLEEDGTVLREVREVKLFEVSPVTFPQYDEAEARIRSQLASAGDLTTGEAIVAHLATRGLTVTEIDGMLRAGLGVLEKTSVGRVPLSVLEREVAHLERF